MKKLIALYLISWTIITLMFCAVCMLFVMFPKLILLPLGLFMLYLTWSTYFFNKKIKNRDIDFDFLVSMQEKDIEKHLK